MAFIGDGMFKKMFFCLSFLSIAAQASSLEYFDAVRNGNAAVVRDFISQDSALINCVDENGNTPLTLAAYYGNLEVVQSLVEKGADVFATDVYGQNSFFNAEAFGHILVMKYLLKQEPKLFYSLDSDGRTPLEAAIANHKRWVVDFLRKYQKDLNGK